MTKDLTTDTNKFTGIITRGTTDVGFRTIDDKAIAKISDFMPEVNRAVASFSKTSSQTTASLMTLTMLESGPYRILRQILAQIEKKRAALKETLYKQEKKKLRREKYLLELDDLTVEDNLKEKRLLLEVDKIEYDLADSTTHIEACIKEIGAYMERYKEVCKNNDIPEQWDEVDFEEAEVEHHIKSMFRNAIRDRMQGSHNMGTMEYFESFGINPIVAYRLVDEYIASIRGAITKDIAPDIGAHYDFFDRMYVLFKDEYKKAAKRIGLDSITQAEFLMKENK